MSAPPDSAAARFEALFEAHHRRVLAYALRRTRREADAEDVVADTFAVAWRKIADVPDGDDALPWLLAVARRVSANQRRSAGRFAGLLARLRAQPDVAPVALPETAASRALDRLPANDLELLRLLAWEGLTQAEAGVALGISANAVAIRLHRARKRFADELMKGSGGSRTATVVEGRTPREQMP